VYACSGASVETTICNGRVLMLDREIPGETETLKNAAHAAAGLVRRASNPV
jgi:5-methylthioadenosine/S-adenosylhomocysteine deaminase